MQLDADYPALVSQSLGHSAKAVQVVGLNTLQEIADDPMLSGRTLPSIAAARLAERLADQGITATEVIHRRMRSTIPKKGPPAFFRNGERPSESKQAETRRQTALFGIRSRTVQQYVVVVLMKYVQYRAGARAGRPAMARSAFAELKAEQQSGARMALQQVDELPCGRLCWTSGPHGAATTASATPPGTCSASSRSHARRVQCVGQTDQPGSVNTIGGASATARAAAQRRAARGGPAARRAPARSAPNPERRAGKRLKRPWRSAETVPGDGLPGETAGRRRDMLRKPGERLPRPWELRSAQRNGPLGPAALAKDRAEHRRNVRCSTHTVNDRGEAM